MERVGFGTEYGKRVRALRERAKLTQQALAIKAGISPSLLTKIEYGLVKSPHVNTLLGVATALASSLGMDPREVFLHLVGLDREEVRHE